MVMMRLFIHIQLERFDSNKLERGEMNSKEDVATGARTNDLLGDLNCEFGWCAW